MRFLGIGDDASLGDMYIRLASAGHEVKVHIADVDQRDILAGFLDRADDWRAALPWIKAAGTEGILLFETAAMGDVQDALRKEGFNVIGGSAFGDRLENDREFGQAQLRALGLRTLRQFEFSDFQAGASFMREHPGRYVFKLNGSTFASSQNYVGELEDGTDVIALLDRNGKAWTGMTQPQFILMEHVSGVEVGVGGYFNGEAFLDAVVIDWEHKRFFNGDIGELTGEMGTLVSYRHAGPLFERTLLRMASQLRASNHVGYINLNMIVNAEGIWPLEFTSRFGYPGFAVCDALHDEGWDALFARMISRKRLDFATAGGFAVGVVLTVPPFPRRDRYETLSKGLPVLWRRPMTDEDKRHIHFGEVALQDDRLVTSGVVGALMTVTGCGETVEDARAAAYRRACNVVVPGLRYRTDIGCRFIDRECALLRNYGLWP